MDLESKNAPIRYDRSTRYLEILLRSFKSQENNEKLKSKYLGWLNDKENTRLIGSKMLHETMLDEAYIEESFRRFQVEHVMVFYL